jgi:anti-sigma factor RsiW
MTCISPPALDDKQLLAYVDGEAGPQIIAHIEQCPHCRAEAHRLGTWQSRLTAQLYRITCPTPEELGEYHLGMLSREQATVVNRHLAECPLCTREVAQLKAYLGELAPALEPSRLEQVKEHVRVLVARLTHGGEASGSWLTPVPAGIRGAEAGPIIYEVDDIQVMLEIHDDTAQPDRKSILGLVVGLDDTQGLEVHVWQAEKLFTTVPVDELGNFVIANLAPATYELILSGSDIEIHIHDLKVGTTD